MSWLQLRWWYFGCCPAILLHISQAGNFPSCPFAWSPKCSMGLIHRLLVVTPGSCIPGHWLPYCNLAGVGESWIEQDWFTCCCWAYPRNRESPKYCFLVIFGGRLMIKKGCNDGNKIEDYRCSRRMKSVVSLGMTSRGGTEYLEVVHTLMAFRWQGNGRNALLPPIMPKSVAYWRYQQEMNCVVLTLLR